VDRRWEYLALLLACLLVTAPLEFRGGGVYRQPARLVRAVLPVLVIFTAWDVAAIARRHWDYNPRFVTGVRLPGAVPLEELLFFVVIPICAVLAYEAVTAMRGADRTAPVDHR